MAELYVYAVTRVHTREQNLLSGQDIEQLIAAGSSAEVLRMLKDKGWGEADTPQNDADALLKAETKKTWDLIEELAGDVAPFNVFRYSNDYHNLKAAIKLNYAGNELPDQDRYFLAYGTVPISTIVKAAKEHHFGELPENMANAGHEAYEVLAQTGNGQLCDMIIDRAALIAIDGAGKASESMLLRRYAELTVDIANIKAAVRSCAMQKPEDFIRKAVAPVGTLNTEQLIRAAADNMEEIFAFLASTAYLQAVSALKTSMANFERWCNDEMIRLIRPQRFNYFGIEPLAAYILGRENEIAMVRLVLSAKANNLNEAMLRERLREMYV